MLYKKISSADSPVNLTGGGLDVLNYNQNSLVIDFDLSGGSVVLNLPSINSLMFSTDGNSGAGGMTFYIKGTIL